MRCKGVGRGGPNWWQELVRIGVLCVKACRSISSRISQGRRLNSKGIVRWRIGRVMTVVIEEQSGYSKGLRAF